MVMIMYQQQKQQTRFSTLWISWPPLSSRKQWLDRPLLMPAFLVYGCNSVPKEAAEWEWCWWLRHVRVGWLLLGTSCLSISLDTLSVNPSFPPPPYCHFIAPPLFLSTPLLRLTPSPFPTHTCIAFLHKADRSTQALCCNITAEWRGCIES